MQCEDCEKEIWLQATHKGRVNRLKAIIAARLSGKKDAQPLSRILDVRPEDIPAEADVAVRELIKEGLVEEPEPRRY